jgi:zinc protease
MKKILTMLAAGLSLMACATASTPGGGGSGAPLRVAPLEYHYRELPNGLRVYAMPDVNTANVAIQMWYNVGYKDDPEGRSGFAHLFEHMLFKSTRNLPDGTFFQITSDVGGVFNASTHEDYTDYFEVVPANHLQRLLFAEAERMGGLVVSPAGLESETDVVKEELRQRVLASPYGRLFYLYLSQANFTTHPYGRPGIGSIEDLESSTIEDVRRFHATYYRPDNAIMVVAGNFDLNQFNAWVDQYFGPIARPSREIPRVNVVEPERTGPRELSVYVPNVPLPAVSASYPHPAVTSPDTPVLHVIDAILSRGQSSRLYQSMVYEQQVATQVFTDWTPSLDPGVFNVVAILSAGKTVDEGVASLRAQLARLRDEPVTQAELEEARNEIVTSTLQGRETALGRSAELADAVFRYGDPRGGDRLLADIQRVTVADIQRVARSVFDDNKRVVIRYMGEQLRPEGVTGDVIETSSNIIERPLTIPASEVPVHTLAAEVDRVPLPAPGAPINARVPPTSERTLANGLRVIVATRPGVPLVSADLRVPFGASADPQGRAGLAALTADLVSKGTTTRSAIEIARTVESLGAALSSGAGPDSSGASIQTRSDRADAVFALLADVARNPAFDAAELDRSRLQTLNGLQVAMRQPGSLAGFAMTRAIYGDGPYGSVATPMTLQSITRDAASEFHRTYWRPDAAVLVIAGDITPAQGFALAQRHFGDWVRPSAPRPALPDASASAPAPRSIVVDLPQTGQAAVALGMRGTSRAAEDYLPTLLANAVLGGGSSARLNQEIRVRRGLSYGAGSGMQPRMAPGPIVATTQTRNDAAAQVVELVEAELNRLRNELPSVAELDARKATIIGGFGRQIETTGGMAGQMSSLALFGLPPERLNTYIGDISAVTPEQVQEAGRRYFDPARADLVVAGDARLFYDALAQSRPGLELIPVTELNLDNASLRPAR